MSTFTVVSAVDRREWAALAEFLTALANRTKVPPAHRWQEKARGRAKRMGLAVYMRGIPGWCITPDGTAWLTENGYA